MDHTHLPGQDFPKDHSHCSAGRQHSAWPTQFVAKWQCLYACMQQVRPQQSITVCTGLAGRPSQRPSVLPADLKPRQRHDSARRRSEAPRQFHAHRLPALRGQYTHRRQTPCGAAAGGVLECPPPSLTSARWATRLGQWDAQCISQCIETPSDCCTRCSYTDRADVKNRLHALPWALQCVA